MLLAMELTPAEVRVLGCLVEKERTTPQLYPLTESALLTACNQSTSRDPIVSYDQATVRRTLLNLRQQGFARMVHRPGDRSEKHKHTIGDAWALDAAEVAVLAVLMLRGPQTVAELRTRTERLHPFASTGEVEAVLQSLATRAPEPFVERLQRQPGQKEARYRHTIGSDEIDEHVVAHADVSRAPAAGRAAPDPSRPAVADLVTQLRDEVEALRSRVERLERELGVE